MNFVAFPFLFSRDQRPNRTADNWGGDTQGNAAEVSTGGSTDQMSITNDHVNKLSGEDSHFVLGWHYRKEKLTFKTTAL